MADELANPRRYSRSEPVTDLRHIRIVDNGEPLVDALEFCPRLVMSRPRWNYTRTAFLRLSVAERLRDATQRLGSQYKIALIEGWRPHYIQNRMYISAWKRWKERHPEWSDSHLKRVVNRYVAPIHGRVPPPHSTGAALDVMLADSDGNELDHSTPFELLDPQGYATDAMGLTASASEHRRRLVDALTQGGLTNYPSEWWHWSFGDQGWAYRTGAPFAVYGLVEPLDWVGTAADMNDDPLEVVRRVKGFE